MIICGSSVLVKSSGLNVAEVDASHLEKKWVEFLFVVMESIVPQLFFFFLWTKISYVDSESLTGLIKSFAHICYKIKYLKFDLTLSISNPSFALQI